ncbi:MAG: hypothetical protein KJO82_07230, partial [Gammaproteobacteria bacterium]|nr:hypothetical protein [Gammaproteobacteria bacterium]
RSRSGEILRALLILVLASILGCQPTHVANIAQDSVSSDAEVIESTILWKAELDPVTWEPMELSSVLSNTDRYVQEGNFYKVEEALYVFDHVALYIGMLGVELVPGPNAVVEGEPSTVSESISAKYPVTFTSNGDSFVAELEKHVRLIVAPHPKIENATIVIGGYFGP